MSDNGKAIANGEHGDLDHLSYEEGYAQLQEVLESLESGELPLEESLQHYEMGVRLAAYCAKKLEAAELRVRRWQDGGGTTSFDGWDADEFN